MQATFHWLRIETFCYATEKEDLVSETFRQIAGTDEFQTDVSESEHGNQMLILQHMITKQRDMDALFQRLGKDLLQNFLDDMENRIDDDCVFYMRLDKQKAVCGEYEISHGGDVISITAKIMAHPAKKEVALNVMRDYLDRLLQAPRE